MFYYMALQHLAFCNNFKAVCSVIEDMTMKSVCRVAFDGFLCSRERCLPIGVPEYQDILCLGFLLIVLSVPFPVIFHLGVFEKGHLDVWVTLTHHLHCRPTQEGRVYVDMEDDAGHASLQLFQGPCQLVGAACPASMTVDPFQDANDILYLSAFAETCYTFSVALATFNKAHSTDSITCSFNVYLVRADNTAGLERSLPDSVFGYV